MDNQKNQTGPAKENEALIFNKKEEPDYKILYTFALGWIEANGRGEIFRRALKDTKVYPYDRGIL